MSLPAGGDGGTRQRPVAARCPAGDCFFGIMNTFVFCLGYFVYIKFGLSYLVHCWSVYSEYTLYIRVT